MWRNVAGPNVRLFFAKVQYLTRATNGQPISLSFRESFRICACDQLRVGRNVFVMFAPLVLVWESVEEKGDVYELEREWTCDSISERIGG